MTILFQKNKLYGSPEYKALVFEAGVSKALWDGAFLPILTQYEKCFKGDLDLAEVRNCLSRRRAFYLPSGCNPEEIHSNKERWTFVVFYLSLGYGCYLKKNKAIPSDLSFKAINEEVRQWLNGDISLKDIVIEVCENNYKSATSKLLAEILNNNKVLTISEFADTAQKDKTVQPLKINDQKRSDAIEFICFISNDTSVQPWKIFDKESIYIETPKGFIEYSKIKDKDWKKIQSGVKKLKLHCLNENELFHKIEKKNYFKFSRSLINQSGEENEKKLNVG